MNFCIHCMEPMEAGAAFCPACGKAQTYECPEQHLRPGTLLAGHFQLGAALGQGGFGITYVARDLKLSKVVAVKEYYPHEFVTRSSTYTANVTATTKGRGIFERGKEKFLKEAQILASLDDEPGIVDVLDYFEENNTAYIVMKFLRGETLKARIGVGRHLSFDEAYRYLRPVMKSLMAAHERHVIHRDIAPDNIMLTDGGATLFDFGAAREVVDEDQSLTIILKRGYAPYEQYTKTDQGPWTDVYALCATLYFCVMGTPPQDALERMKHPDAPLPFDSAAFSPQAQAVLSKGLAMLPEQRWRSVREMMRALDKADRPPAPPVQGTPTQVTPSVKPQPQTPQMQTSVQPTPVVQPQPAVQPAPVPEPNRSSERPAPVQPVSAEKRRPKERIKTTEPVWQGPVPQPQPERANRAANQPKQQKTPEKKNHPAIILVAVLLVVALAIGGLVWAASRKQSDGTKTGTAETVTADTTKAAALNETEMLDLCLTALNENDPSLLDDYWVDENFYVAYKNDPAHEDDNRARALFSRMRGFLYLWGGTWDQPKNGQILHYDYGEGDQSMLPLLKENATREEHLEDLESSYVYSGSEHSVDSAVRYIFNENEEDAFTVSLYEIDGRWGVNAIKVDSDTKFIVSITEAAEEAEAEPSTTQPTTTTEPTTTTQPTTTTEPTTTTQPSTTRQPTTTRPTTTTQPSTTRQPSTTQPTTTRQPSTTRQPTTASTPRDPEPTAGNDAADPEPTAGN